MVVDFDGAFHEPNPYDLLDGVLYRATGADSIETIRGGLKAGSCRT